MLIVGGAKIDLYVTKANKYALIELKKAKCIISRFDKVSDTKFQKLKKTFSATHILMPNNKINRFNTSSYVWKNKILLYSISIL